MDGVGGIAGWRWIFILEGLLTVLIGVASFWVMQGSHSESLGLSFVLIFKIDYPDKAKFLTEEESASSFSHVTATDANRIVLGVYIVRGLEEDLKFSASGERFDFKYVWQSLRDWKTYVASMCILLPIPWLICRM